MTHSLTSLSLYLSSIYLGIFEFSYAQDFKSIVALLVKRSFYLVWLSKLLNTSYHARMSGTHQWGFESPLSVFFLDVKTSSGKI